MGTETEFAAAVARTGRAAAAFVSGDPAPYRSMWAQDADVTIFGGWGDHERGWEEVGPRLDWAAERFLGGSTQQHVLVMASSGDLGYSVALERGQAHLAGQAEPADMVLRVTHVYRRVDGAWKVVHRHADPLVGKTATAAVLASHE
jgi:ketosteroid isomerase-like protein